MKLTIKQWTARAEAWLEAADHLQLNWTDDKEEMIQGNIVSDLLRKKSDECFAKSADLICKTAPTSQPHP